MPPETALRSKPLASCLYVGKVRHHRSTPVEHVFDYSLFQVYLDLAELDVLFRGRWLWSTSRPALARFRREDHLGPPTTPLSVAVQDLVESRLGWRPTGPIRLLTNLRYFGYVINPISLYYCFDDTDTNVVAVVAEVHNTPWGEQHCYVLDWPAEESLTANAVDRGMLRATQDKAFHVSPFMEMNHSYRWCITPPGEALHVNIENIHSGRQLHVATLSLQRRPITTLSLATVLLRHPWMTARVVSGIYWQALKLWWKGVKYVPHPSSSHLTPTT